MELIDVFDYDNLAPSNTRENDLNKIKHTIKELASTLINSSKTEIEVN